jgi:hypothetical protein
MAHGDIPRPDTAVLRTLFKSRVEGILAGEITPIDLSLLENSHFIDRLQEAAIAAAAEKMKLIDQLSGAPLTRKNIASWLEIIEGLEPGPYSEYVLRNIGDAATTEGPVRNELLSIQESWQTKCGDKQFYEADLTRLANALQPRNSNSLIKSVLNFLQLHNPFR